MNKTDMKGIIDNIKIDKTLISQIEKKYGDVPNEVKKILSYKENRRFIGDWRVVSKQEILVSVEEIHVDFVAENIIPVFDTMDNDFICYDLKKKNWTLFNIVDRIKFSPQKDICDFLEQ